MIPLFAKVTNLASAPKNAINRVFRYRDFRLLWFGAFLSFIGSWIQNIAQGQYVYDITGSKEALARIALCNMLPVTLLGLIAGSFVDRWDKKKLLLFCQIFFAGTTALVAILFLIKRLEVWHLYTIALANGVVSVFEMPTRQAIVAGIVSKEDLAAAIPLQALTFNLARVIGPAIGGFLISYYGIGACYSVNALSFLALIFACGAMKFQDPRIVKRSEPIRDLVQEGLLYTWREPRLRVIFILETAISFFALFYLAQIPAIAKDLFGLKEAGTAQVTFAVGLGSLLALTVTSITAEKHVRGFLLRGSASLLGLLLVALSFTRSIYFGFPVILLMGMCSVMIFNTCNFLFQSIAPENLRGRVVSMHVFALSGLGALGVYPFGYLAETVDLPYALNAAGILTICIAIWSWTVRTKLESDSRGIRAEVTGHNNS